MQAQEAAALVPEPTGEHASLSAVTSDYALFSENGASTFRPSLEYLLCLFCTCRLRAKMTTLRVRLCLCFVICVISSRYSRTARAEAVHSPICPPGRSGFRIARTHGMCFPPQCNVSLCSSLMLASSHLVFAPLCRVGWWVEGRAAPAAFAGR